MQPSLLHRDSVLTGTLFHSSHLYPDFLAIVLDHCNRLALLCERFTDQRETGLVYMAGSLFPGSRWWTATERLPRFTVVQSGTQQRYSSRLETNSRWPPKYAVS